MVVAERKLSEENKIVLKKIIGKTIKSLRMGENEEISAPFGMVIIDFSDGTSIQLTNTEESVPFFDQDAKEEIVGFSCAEYLEDDTDSEDGVSLITYSLQESTIKSIEIVTDKIAIQSSKFDDYEIIFDAGIILHGDKHDYVFSLDSLFFYETILYSTNGDINKMRPIEDVRRAWLGDETSHITDVNIERSSEIL